MKTTLGSKAHADLIAAFEREYKGRRFDKEPKELWSGGRVYQDGPTNDLFVAYRRGAAYGEFSAR